MAESISRLLRDGSLDGEHAPALTLKDSLQSPLGSYAFDHFLSSLVANVAAGKSQSSGVVIVAFSKSPSFYFDLMKSKGLDTSLLDKWVRILDCYSDPLGWKDGISKSGSDRKDFMEESVSVFKTVKDIAKLLNSILDLGKGFVREKKSRFGVAIDSAIGNLRKLFLELAELNLPNSCGRKDVGNLKKLFLDLVELNLANKLGRRVGVGCMCFEDYVKEAMHSFLVIMSHVSDILRHVSLPSVAGLISSLRSQDQISCIFWLIHSDLHEPRASAALEYISTMVGSLEPMIPSPEEQRSSENLIWLEQNSHKGKFHVRLKRRNGRVKLVCEECHMEQGGIKFSAVSFESVIVNQSLVPKVQFNLQLSEKERVDRARVVLPFEHQGNGEVIQIYDGRQSLSQGNMDDAHQMKDSAMSSTATETNSVKGEIHYIRDSDDEHPDSDEDPDDDLDI